MESLAELDRGEIVSAEDLRRQVEEIIANPEESACATEMTIRVVHSATRGC